jgi:hypothetical protein
MKRMTVIRDLLVGSTKSITEALHGFYQSARNNAISRTHLSKTAKNKAYENEGITGRARARALRPKDCLEVEDVSEWGAVIQDTLKSLLSHGWSPELQVNLDRVHDMLVMMHCSVPGNQLRTEKERESSR